MKSETRFAVTLTGFAAALNLATGAQAVQFNILDPGYVQEIYAAPLTPNQEAGMAWTSSGNLLTRAGSTIIEYGPTQNAVVNGTNVHAPLASRAGSVELCHADTR